MCCVDDAKNMCSRRVSSNPLDEKPHGFKSINIRLHFFLVEFSRFFGNNQRTFNIRIFIVIFSRRTKETTATSFTNDDIF